MPEILSSRDHDLVIFGASGYTGQYLVEEAAKTDKKWAVAGRNAAKIGEVLAKVGKQLERDLSSIPVIIADVEDEESLKKMATSTQLVINCVGPYSQFGEPVVRACVEEGTSHVDVSGEPTFLEKMQLEYTAQAKETGAYVVGTCGWDSIPFETGLLFTQKSFPGDLSSIESFLQPHAPADYSINSGTFHSMVEGFSRRKEVGPLRRQLMPDRPPKSPFKLQPRGALFYEELVGGYCIPFLGSDKSVGQRSLYLEYHENQRRHIQLQTYVSMGTWCRGLSVILWGIQFAALASLSVFHDLLKKHVSLFSFGFFSDAGPTREQEEAAGFEYWFVGRGWKTRLPVGEEHLEAPPEKIITKIKAKGLGYIPTAQCAMACALTILEEKDRLPYSGGVYPPGFAFRSTDLLTRLSRVGFQFEVVESSLVEE